MVAFAGVYLIIVLISALIVGFLAYKAPVVEDETMLSNVKLESIFPKDTE